MANKKKPLLRFTPAWMKKKKIEKAAKKPQRAESTTLAARRMADVEATIDDKQANKTFLDEEREARKTWNWKAREKASKKYRDKYKAFEEMNKAKGGYVKKYAKGGGVRKVKT